MNVLIERAGGAGELARKSRLSRRVIDKYRTGESDPSRERLIALAAAGPVSLVWLATGEGSAEPGPIRGRIGGEQDPDYVLLPWYDVKAAAGAGEFMVREPAAEYVYFHRDWLHRTLARSPGQLAMIVATGDSMAATINGGDLLVIDISDPRFRGDGVYVLSVDDAVMVKRVGMRLAGGLRISSDNPKYAEILEIPRDEVRSRVRIVGRVVWVGGVI